MYEAKPPSAPQRPEGMGFPVLRHIALGSIFTCSKSLVIVHVQSVAAIFVAQHG